MGQRLKSLAHRHSGPFLNPSALPAGAEPIRALHAFRDNATSLLLCTPQASRGLDLPAVSHVYNMGLPEDGTQYLHRAGRAGRIGSIAGAITCASLHRNLHTVKTIIASFGRRLHACFVKPDAQSSFCLLLWCAKFYVHLTCIDPAAVRRLTIHPWTLTVGPNVHA